MKSIIVDGITYRVGCLIEAVKNGEVGVYAHQANCMSVFGAGIAPHLGNNFPELLHEDATCPVWPEERLGGVTHTDLDSPPIGFNLYGQLFPGRNTDYEALSSALGVMNSILKQTDKRHTVGIPKIGCGIGGGDWSVVSLLIKKQLTDVDPVVYILSEKELPHRSYVHESGIVF